MKVGIIDLGSNTFHLLVTELSPTGFEEVHRERIFVGLAEGGLVTIKPAAIVRAQEAIQKLADSVKDHNVDQLKIIGTAAMRSAHNAYIINDTVRDALGQEIEIISGKREAELIYKGIRLLSDMDQDSHLIMDIGGGSTEFIIVKDGKLLWSQSFNIGVAVLHELFHKSEPMATADISAMEGFLDRELDPLRQQVTEHRVSTLIGASGSFEVVATMAGRSLEQHSLQTFHLDSFEQLEKVIVSSDYAEREQLKGMPASRVKLIVVAFLLIRYILKLTGCDGIAVSPYALKEGLIAEAMEG